ncbi:MAG: PTS mannose transporter subunit IIA [Gammaproteobacteria bacterium]|nr:PTS mannose transporter subunit IIA [Gammaproteobacteria bacterium]
MSNYMSVTILIISHGNTGSALVETATKAFHELPLTTTAVNVESNTDPDVLLPKLQRLINNISQTDGVLILTDLMGSTPSNIAKALQKNANIRIISGLNLPMLMKIMNYPDLSLNELAAKAINGGREGVIECAN